MIPHLENSLQVTRRHFLAIAISAWAVSRWRRLLGESRAQERPTRCVRVRRISRQGEERHLSAHGRLAAAPRSLRLQAGAGARNRRELPRVVPARPALRLHQRRAAKLLGTPQRFRPAWPIGARGFPERSSTSRPSPTNCASSSRCTPSNSITPPRSSCFSPVRRSSAGRRWAHGSPTASARKARICPGFIALVSSGTFPSAGNSDWNNGFLPSVYQGVQCRSQGDPVLYVIEPGRHGLGMRRLSLDALRDLNEMQATELGNPETRTRIAQYELAFRMQTAVPEVMDISRESQRVIDRCTAPSPARPASPTIACWPAA